MSSPPSDPLAALREWGYRPGPFATDHHDLFPDDFEWGTGDEDDKIFAKNWAKIACRPGVVWLRFGNHNKAVPDEVWDEWPCILQRTRFLGPLVLPASLTSVLGVFDCVEEEGLFALDDPDEWMVLVMTHDALRVTPSIQSEM